MDELSKHRAAPGDDGAGPAGRKRLREYRRMARDAVKQGLLPAANLAAALAIAAQIARLEARFDRAYEDDEAAGKAACTVGALEQMGRAEKHLADLKERFFQMTGHDRLHLARVRQLEGSAKGGGDIVLDTPGIAPPPLQAEHEEGPPWALR